LSKSRGCAKAGKYEGSAKAAISHTGSMTGDYAVFCRGDEAGGATFAKTIESLLISGRRSHAAKG